VRKIPIISLIAAFAVAAPVHAAVNTPPGNSGISQYLEVVPDAKGNSRSSGRSTKKVLTKSQHAAIVKAGPSGAPLADFVSETAPDKPVTHKAKAKTKAKTNAKAKADDREDDASTIAIDAKSGTSRPSALAATIVDDGGVAGMGLWLPILMAVSAAAAIFAGWRRRGPDETP
jgi:hypothetical protein